jgi:hypothetical protein
VLFPDGLDSTGSYSIRNQQISIKRQVRPVLLDGPERLHDDA